jgi:subtilisin family serine protease
MDVASMSLGGGYNSSFETACANAYTAGLVMVAAAGNSSGPVGYPAAYAEVIAVSATGDYENQLPSDALASFSCYGPEVDLAAPGVAILSTYKGGEYKEASGTSMACPHVAGTVALMKAAGRELSFLYSTADGLGEAGKDDYYGNGLVDAEEATTGSETGDN